MKRNGLELMSIDELWTLHETIMTILSSKIETQKRELEKRLDQLGRKLGGSADHIPQRRPYPKVMPKFQNPAQPFETWSGRGKQPRWVSEMLDAGKSMDDLRIPESA
jgi:DNA-binding protein H-NS